MTDDERELSLVLCNPSSNGDTQYVSGGWKQEFDDTPPIDLSGVKKASRGLGAVILSGISTVGGSAYSGAKYGAKWAQEKLEDLAADASDHALATLNRSFGPSEDLYRFKSTDSPTTERSMVVYNQEQSRTHIIAGIQAMLLRKGFDPEVLEVLRNGDLDPALEEYMEFARAAGIEETCKSILQEHELCMRSQASSSPSSRSRRILEMVGLITFGAVSGKSVGRSAANVLSCVTGLIEHWTEKHLSIVSQLGGRCLPALVNLTPTPTTIS